MNLSPGKFLIIALLIFSGGIFLFLTNPNHSAAVVNLPTSATVIVVCGDGIWEPESGEACDAGNSLQGHLPDFGTSTCGTYNDVFGHPFTTGSLTCASDCSAIISDKCHTCGNGYKETIEQCDASDFGSQSCISFGFESGSLLCSHCSISTVNCTIRSSEGGVPGSGSSGGGSGATTGYNPGQATQQPTKVIASGSSYPDSDVHILVDGKVIGIVKADSQANFYFESADIVPGVASFGFWSQDKNSLKSTLLTLTFQVVSQAATTISGIYISPTIEINKSSVKQGELVSIYGQTVPQTQVNVHINSNKEIVQNTNSKNTGDWNLNFDTTPLEEGFHTAKASFQSKVSGNIIESGFSRSISFNVGKLGGQPECPNGDLNKDGRVNLTDFSILLYYWTTNNACADQNQNGTVDLVDFSIMMYYWTG
jgi:hypothetical protein